MKHLALIAAVWFAVVSSSAFAQFANIGPGTPGNPLSVSTPDAGPQQTNTSNQITGTCSSSCLNTALFTVDTTGYQSISVQVTSAGTGATISYQSSDDAVCSSATNWISVIGSPSTSTINGYPAQSSGTTGELYFPTRDHCFRAYITSYSSGTVSIESYLRSSTYIGFVYGTFAQSSTDPCASSAIAKSSVAINLTSAAASQLVALSGSTVVYVCGFSATIAPSATSAATLQFEYGTGSNCGTGTTVLTGTYGNGDLTTTVGPLPVQMNGPGTIFKTAAGNALCAAGGGTTVNVQGVLTFVQQ